MFVDENHTGGYSTKNPGTYTDQNLGTMSSIGILASYGEGIKITNKDDEFIYVTQNTNLSDRFNDRIKSVIVPADWKVSFFADPNQTGIEYPYNPGSYSGGSHFETISSVKIVKRPVYASDGDYVASPNVPSPNGTIFNFPNGEITTGPLRHPLTAASVLSSIFITRQQEELLSEYIEAISYNLGDDDYRLVNSDNVENYSKLMRMVLSGQTGMNGSTLAGYSIDFINLRDASSINEFLVDSLIRPAVSLGLIHDDLYNTGFADILRRYILAELEQDSSFEYGSDEHYKASLALQYSSNFSSSIQFNHALIGQDLEIIFLKNMSMLKKHIGNNLHKQILI